MSLLFNMLSRMVIAFLPRSKCLLISWLQSPSAVILEPPKLKSLIVSTVSPSICHEVMGPDALILVFWTLSFKPTFSLSYFIKRLSISSLFYAITVVSSAYLRLLSKMHCCYIIISTDLKEKHTFEQDELCYLIISYGLKKLVLKIVVITSQSLSKKLCD